MRDRRRIVLKDALSGRETWKMRLRCNKRADYVDFCMSKQQCSLFYWFRQIGELGVEEWIDIAYALVKLLWLLFCEKSARWGMAN